MRQRPSIRHWLCNSDAASHMMGLIVAGIVTTTVMATALMGDQNAVADVQNQADHATRDNRAERILKELLGTVGTDEVLGLKHPKGGIQGELFWDRERTVWSENWGKGEFTDDPLVYARLKAVNPVETELDRLAKANGWGYRLEAIPSHRDPDHVELGGVRAAYFGNPPAATTGTGVEQNDATQAQLENSAEITTLHDMGLLFSPHPVNLAAYLVEEASASAQQEAAQQWANASSDAEDAGDEAEQTVGEKDPTNNTLGDATDQTANNATAGTEDTRTDACGTADCEGVSNNTSDPSGAAGDDQSALTYGDIFPSTKPESVDALIDMLPDYNLLVLGSRVDLQQLDRSDLRIALHEWITLGGGYLMVLGNPDAGRAPVGYSHPADSGLDGTGTDEGVGFLQRYLMPSYIGTSNATTGAGSAAGDQDMPELRASGSAATNWRWIHPQADELGFQGCIATREQNELLPGCWTRPWIVKKFRHYDGAGREILYPGWGNTGPEFNTQISVSNAGEYGAAGRIALIGSAVPPEELLDRLLRDRSLDLYKPKMHLGYEIPADMPVSTALRLSYIHDDWAKVPVEVRMHVWDIQTEDAVEGAIDEWDYHGETGEAGSGGCQYGDGQSKAWDEYEEIFIAQKDSAREDYGALWSDAVAREERDWNDDWDVYWKDYDIYYDTCDRASQYDTQRCYSTAQGSEATCQQESQYYVDAAQDAKWQAAALVDQTTWEFLRQSSLADDEMPFRCHSDICD